MPLNNSKFNIAGLQDFTRQHGEIVNYYTGLKCTCGANMQQTGTTFPDPNRSNPSCVACKGLGWVWISAGTILGMVTSIDQHKDLLAAGIALPGDLIFSPQLGTNLAEYDMIQLNWSPSIPFEGEVIVRGSGTTDTAYYGIVTVDDCITVDPSTGTITHYTAGTDFSFDSTTITWGLSSNQIPYGVPYSIRYTANIDWICFVPPQPRRERQTSLGQRVVLRKKHTVFNGV